MTPVLKILWLEDSSDDAELISATLAHEGIVCDPLRVETKEDFVHAIEQNSFDLILSDCTLPAFDGLSALKIARQKVPDVPFIFVSGTIGEEVAIETLKGGATDYVLKHRLARLAPAIQRALAEVEERAAREQAERSKSEAESLFGVLFDQVTVGVAIVSLEGALVKVNPALQEMFGFVFDSEAEPATLRRISLDEFTHPEDRGPDSRTLDELRTGKRTSHQLEKRFTRSDGAVVWAQVVQSLIRDADNAPRFFLYLITDITERKELEQRFLQAQKMEVVGRLAAGIAHDFNNFLTVINAYSQILTGRFSDQHREIQEIRSAGEHAAKLTKRLLALGRPEIHQLTVLDLNTAVSSVDDMLRRLIGEEIQLTMRLDPATGPIEAGQDQIEQLIMNLCINARDAMPQGGNLTIVTNNVALDAAQADRLGLEPGDFVELVVSDTGHGMDEQTRAKIFEAFFTTKGHAKGTGLGLWMVQQVVQHSRGAIGVDSTPGQGTSFRVYLPRAAGATQAHSGATSSPGVTVAAETILVIEEDHSVRQLVTETLRTAGYEVLTNLPAGKQDQVDLVISGFTDQTPATDPLSGLLASRPGTKVLFLLNAFGDLAFEEGVAYLQKPLQRDDLVQRVREVLDAPLDYCILVTDDDRAIRNVLRDVLRPSGFRVLEASGGRQAISHLREETVHLLIVDLIMEDQEGLETIRLAKKDFPNLKIIAMSGGFGEKYLDLAKALGANEVIAKPFRPEVIREMVRCFSLDSMQSATATN